jgi:hypothetical protein
MAVEGGGPFAKDQFRHKEAWPPGHRCLGPFDFIKTVKNRGCRLKLDYPELRRQVWQSTSVFEVSGASVMILENPSKRFIRTPDRTNILKPAR